MWPVNVNLGEAPEVFLGDGRFPLRERLFPSPENVPTYVLCPSTRAVEREKRTERIFRLCGG